ncbi:MAG: hypothetical protein OSJ62_04985 [Lachnospiraceae bacterium]|nr:hypothetical protein [Lachnospiraceae bacterium]
MTDKEKFLSILTYEEFDKRRGEFRELSMSDKDVLEHASKIFGKSPNPLEELYTILPNGKRVIGNKKDYRKL